MERFRDADRGALVRRWVEAVEWGAAHALSIHESRGVVVV